jgi:hypothetical protein
LFNGFWFHSTRSLRFPRLSRYFSEELLTSTKVVVIDPVPMPPLSSMGLSRFAEFVRGDYDGITYLDTFFVKRRSAAEERLHFQELIHVVQLRSLGPEAFLAAYAGGLENFGYRDSPLESMAYNAEALFCQSDERFDAEKLVTDQLSRMRAGCCLDDDRAGRGGGAKEDYMLTELMNGNFASFRAAHDVLTGTPPAW